jgi:hypothetical protein
MSIHDRNLTSSDSTARIAPGVYFSLPEDRYHADPALGSGDIRKLFTCPMYYWRTSHMNPMREAGEETPALLFGRALHKLVLEGREAFVAAYTCAPEAADHPGCFITVDDIKRALKDLGEKVTGNKPELIARLKARAPDAVILDDILAAHAEQAQRAGQTVLKRAVFEEVVIAAGFIAADKRVAPAFQGGRPEISVFWEQDGVPLKCRIDYLRFGRSADRRLLALDTDLKSFANQRDMPPEIAVRNAVAEYRLDIQAAHNLAGAAQIGRLIAEGKVFGGEGINPQWLEALGTVQPEDHFWHWAFYQKDAPVTILRSATPHLIARGRRDVETALRAYRDNMAAFGTQWRYVDPMADMSLDVTDMPAWMDRAA